MEKPQCVFCGSYLVEDDDYCNGCGSYICSECAEKVKNWPFGVHTLEDHEVEPREYWD